MTTHHEQKAKNAGISLYPWEIEKIRGFAAANAGGNVSATIRRAMAAIGCDLDPDTTAQQPAGPIVNLAQRYAPADAVTLAHHFADLDQAATLSRWLREAGEVFALGVPVAAVHLAGEHEISALPLPLHARRYIPRLPRARWVAASAALYPEHAPHDLSANEPPEPKPDARK